MAVDTGRVRAILFDIDGTLRDTDDQWVARLARFLQPAAFLLPRRDSPAAARRLVMGVEYPGNLALYYADRLGLDNLAARAAGALRRARAGRPASAPRAANWPAVDASRSASARSPADAPPPVTPPAPISTALAPVPGVVEALTLLAVHFPLAVVSARPERSTMAFLDGNHLSPLFKAIATGQTTRYTKPFPDPILWAARQLGVSPQTCLMVGDTTPDIRAGRAAGAQTLGVLCGFGDELELRAAGADDILASTANLPALFNLYAPSE